MVLQIFGADPPFAAVRWALLAGQLVLVLSNEMLTEYEEAAVRFSGAAYWNRAIGFFGVCARLHGNIVPVSPTFRFGLILADPDDNKFVDCAIVANADYILTEDRHFAALTGSGCRPQPITPQTFIDQHLPPLS